MFYILVSGCTWHLLPHDFPAWSTVYYYFRQWRQEQVWQQFNQVLREKVRSRAWARANSERSDCGQPVSEDY